MCIFLQEKFGFHFLNRDNKMTINCKARSVIIIWRCLETYWKNKIKKLSIVIESKRNPQRQLSTGSLCYQARPDRFMVTLKDFLCPWERGSGPGLMSLALMVELEVDPCRDTDRQIGLNTVDWRNVYVEKCLWSFSNNSWSHGYIKWGNHWCQTAFLLTHFIF